MKLSSTLRSKTALVDKRGSLAESQKQRGLSFAEAFMHVEAIICCDISGSMDQRDVAAEGGPCSRWEEANRQLQRLQARFPGRLAVVAFSDTAEFCPDGTLPSVRGGTNLLGALQFISPAAACNIRFIVCSDGEPDSVSETLDYARSLKTRIDTVHIGSSVRGKQFMEELARCSMGQAIDESVLELESVVTKLLTDGK